MHTERRTYVRAGGNSHTATEIGSASAGSVYLEARCRIGKPSPRHHDRHPLPALVITPIPYSGASVSFLMVSTMLAQRIAVHRDREPKAHME
jgi:hypothetical protein